MPVLFQPRIANAKPASQIMIDTYMAALGFEKGTDVGRFKNKEYETWDILPRNVLVDADGDIYVVDAEIKTALTVRFYILRLATKKSRLLSPLPF